MLLVIDVGNTNIVAGVFDDKELVCHWIYVSFPLPREHSKDC